MLEFSSPSSVNAVIVWVVTFVAGAVVASLVWRSLAATFAQPLFARTNHRGRSVPVAAGIVLFLTSVVVAGAWRFVDSAFGWSDSTADLLGDAALVAGGFGLLGFFDDVAAHGDDRGFGGHLGALTQGRLTTGAVKLLGGGFLALAIAPTWSHRDWWHLLLGAAVIALAANTANLFDRAPARCTKLAVICAIPLFLACDPSERFWLSGVALIIGAAIGLVFFDAREDLMLGDAGSNVLGAVLGWGLVATTGWVAQVVTLVVLVALNVASEKVSFSKVIEKNRFLRAADRFGRAAPPEADP